MILNQVTAPTSHPVSLADVKLHLRLPATYTDEDTTLSLYISAAVRMAEENTGIQLMPAVWCMVFDRFPDVIYLRRPPVVSVTHIKYYNQSNVLTTLDPAYFIVDTDSQPGRVDYAPGKSWPSTKNRIGAVRVTYASGFADATKVPANIRAAIMLIVGDLYANRENIVIGRTTNQIPRTAEMILAGERIEFIDSLKNSIQ